MKQQQKQTQQQQQHRMDELTLLYWQIFDDYYHQFEAKPRKAMPMFEDK